MCIVLRPNRTGEQHYEQAENIESFVHCLQKRARIACIRLQRYKKLAKYKNDLTSFFEFFDNSYELFLTFAQIIGQNSVKTQEYEVLLVFNLFAKIG